MCIYIYVCVCVCVCVCVYIYIYICMYFELYWVGTIIIPFLQMVELRHTQSVLINL